MKCRSVLRESTEALKEGYGFANQREQCLDFAKNREREIVKEHRLVESSSTWDREKFDAIIAEAIRERDEMPGIIFPRVDRFARNLEAAGYYLGLLRQNGLSVMFAQEEIEVTNKASVIHVLMFFIHSFKADQDGKQIKQNMLGGRDKLAKNFQLPTGAANWVWDYKPKRLYGKLSSGKPELNLTNANWVRKWTDWLLDEGVSLLEIKRRMEEAKVPAPRGGTKWSPATISRILRNPTLVGQFKWKGQQIDGILQSEAVLTVERFQMLQQRLDEIKENKSQNAVKLDYPPLRGMVFCHCGRRMGGCPIHGYPYYRCNVCRKPLVNANWLWRELSMELKDDLTSQARLIPAVRRQVADGDLIEREEKDLRQAEERLKFLEGKWDALYRLASPDYPIERFKAREQEVMEALNKAKEERSQIEIDLSTLKQRKIDEEGIGRFCKIVSQNIDNLTKQQWEILLKMVKLEVTIHEAGQISVKVALPPIGEEVENQIPSL